MKKPTQSEIVIAIILMLAWFYAMLVYSNYDMERAGSLTIGAVVGVIFALFGYSATKGLKNTLMIVGVSFIATMVYHVVSGLIHYVY